MQAKSKRRLRVRKIDESPYVISEDEKIGETSRGSVSVAYNYEKPNEQLVVKVVNIQNPQDLEPTIQSIIKISQLPSHQNLVRYQHCQRLSQNSYCIIMDKCNEGSVVRRLTDIKLIPQQKIWTFLTQFCKGYRVLFDAQIIHFAIKPSNILLNDGIYKITDFGIINNKSLSSIARQFPKNNALLYMAPEIERANTTEINSKFDVFSLGCIVYQFAYDGSHFMQSQINKISNPQQYFEALRKNQLVIKQKNKKGQVRSAELRQLIKGMLQLNSEKRLSWQKIFEQIKINVIQQHHEKIEKPINQKQTEIQTLKTALSQANRSSIIMEFQDQQSSEFEHLSMQQLLDRQEIKYLQQVMFRLKILFLTITHCNTKISAIIRENTRRKRLESHMIDSIKKVATEGFLYLLKNIEIITNKISDYSPSVSKEIKTILDSDRQKILEEYKKQMKVFKNMQEEKFNEMFKIYDLRSFQHCLYSLLTVYCDYYKEGKDTLRVVISILIDVYDTSLRLTEMTQKQKIAWRNPEFEQIQTKMDQICMNRHETHEFYNYLMSKETITEKQLTESLKRVGLLFE